MEFLFKLFLQMLINAMDNPKIPKVIRLLILSIVLLMLITISILAGFSAIVSANLNEVIIYWMIAAGCMLLWVLGCYTIYQIRKANSNDYYCRILLSIKLKDSKWNVFYWRFSLSQLTTKCSQLKSTSKDSKNTRQIVNARRSLFL